MACMHSKQKSAHAQQSSKSIRINTRKKEGVALQHCALFRRQRDEEGDDASLLSLRKTRQFVSKCKSLVVATVKYRVPISWWWPKAFRKDTHTWWDSYHRGQGGGSHLRQLRLTADRRRVFPHRIISNWKKACPRYNPANPLPVTPLVLDSKWCVEALASARTQSSRSKFGPKRVNSKKVATRTQRKSPIWRKKTRMLLLGYTTLNKCKEDLAHFWVSLSEFENSQKKLPAILQFQGKSVKDKV